MRDGQRILVTGAAGFIGSHGGEALLREGATVIGLDNFDPFYPRDVKEGVLAELREAEGADRFRFAECDLRSPGDLAQLFDIESPTSVIHLAAKAGVRPSIAEPAAYMDVNITGTVNLLELCRRHEGIDRIVVASSSSVYGNRSKVPFSEEDPVGEPISPYAASKRSCELIGHAFHHLHGLPIAMLRFFTVYGPRQRPDLAIAKFIERIESGGTIQMFGDGTTSRDYTYIDDIVAGVLASHDRITEHGYRIWNLGGNEPVTLSAMIDTVASACGREAKIERLPMQPGAVEKTYADQARSGAALGYAPATSFSDGVARQVAWTRDRGGVG